MVTRLSAADAVSLHTQTSSAPAHTVTLIITEASDQLSHERLHRLIASSLPLMARFRSRLVCKPLGLGQPLWAAIEDYDPTPQIHRATVRAPGGPSEFADLIAQLTTGPQDLPLWEAWSIDGLAGRRWALAVKMSPALSDGGAAAALVWPRLLHAGSRDDPANDLPTEPSLGSAPSLGDMVTDVITEIVEKHVTGAWLLAEGVTGALRTARDRLSGAGVPEPTSPPASSRSGPAPHTRINGPLTPQRAVAFASIPLTALKTVSNAFGGSITNVFLAACTLSLRTWLQHHDTVPDHPLVMQMPLAPRDGDSIIIDNPLAVGRIRLPVQLDDPVQVLTNLHTATERLKTARSHIAERDQSTTDFAKIASLIPPIVARAGMHLFTRLGLAPICHGRVSYIPGNPVPAYCAGARVVGMHTVAPLREGCGLTIAVTYYGDALDLSVSVCPEHVPAVNDIATGIVESVDVLVAAARESPRGHGRSVVTEMTSHTANHSRGRRR